MKEYKFEVVSPENIVSTLNEAGLENWEPVSIQTVIGGSEPVLYVVWQRPV